MSVYVVIYKDCNRSSEDGISCIGIATTYKQAKEIIKAEYKFEDDFSLNMSDNEEGGFRCYGCSDGELFFIDKTPLPKDIHKKLNVVEAEQITNK
jgi:hypothetical protein